LLGDRSDNGATGWEVTPPGCEVLERVVAARRAHLEEVFGEWTAEEREDLAAMLRRVTRELVPDVRTGEHRVVT
jgi:DNA-binding MarR family transcriptional regulator